MLEESIKDLSAAMREVAAAINANRAFARERVEACKSEPATVVMAKAVADVARGQQEADKAAIAAYSKTPTADGKPAAKEVTEAVAQLKPSAPSIDVIDYERDIKPAFLKLVSEKGREAGRAIIDHYAPGVKKLTEAITPEQYADCLTRINLSLVA